MFGDYYMKGGKFQQASVEASLRFTVAILSDDSLCFMSRTSRVQIPTLTEVTDDNIVQPSIPKSVNTS